ncbi:MAG TPA: carboxypeptidase-like regulatory domain-containing protein, partial [Bacteroidales bacterium]|nr:carboxypeptidase-like regulatory domain-containing protein [Bacteroidales bacterium]HPT12868.1 carboxypeptidase-like regulatory domain-containing protein [Bacteroidales bacterium]
MQFCKKIRIIFILILFTNALSSVSGQERLVSGMLTDSTGVPLESVSVIHRESRRGITSDAKGRFTLSVPVSTTDNSIYISLVGYVSKTISFDAGKNDISLPVIVLNQQLQSPGSVRVTALRRSDATEILIPVSTGFVMPSITHEIESIVRTLPGVSTFSELSNQYSVRGGSYDENLVYIDGIETEKPYLIRYGQQEGLSQINPDFVSS